MSDLPARLAAGVSALRSGRADEAVALLEGVVDDADLAAATDLADVRARALSLCAQALLDVGRVVDAERRVREALRLLRRLGDASGTAEVRGLQDRIVAALAHDHAAGDRAREHARIVATPLDDLLAGASTGPERAAAHVKKAVAHLEQGDAPTAAALAQGALDATDDPTWCVHAQLVLARARPSEADTHALAAYRIAERAGEFNLVSLVARSAEELGVALPKEPGPHAGRPPRKD